MLHVAPSLLGTLLITDSDESRIVSRIVEVEAYAGETDPASHAYRGETPRNSVMFGPPGHAYVYFTYGMHFCLNVTVGPDAFASAVLVRAATIVEGVELARSRRPKLSDRDLARGPGRLCAALGIDRSHNGEDLCDPRSRLWLAEAAEPDDSAILSGPRVGISTAVDRPWRFWLDGEPAVSAYRPGTRSTRAPSAGRVVKRLDQ